MIAATLTIPDFLLGLILGGVLVVVVLFGWANWLSRQGTE